MGQTVITPRPDLPTAGAGSPAASAHDPAAGPGAELDRQLQVYLDLGYAELLGRPAQQVRESVERLRGPAAATGTAPDVPAEDHVPFVLVLGARLLPINDRVPGMRRGARHGISVIGEDEASTYRPVAGVAEPSDLAYLVTGVDVGASLVGVTPEAALHRICTAGRTPLTIAEGLALVTVRPDMLRPNRCFSLAGSRTGTDQRVPAIWISEGRPKLGWCWDRNAHTWLGTASAVGRRA